MWIRQSPFNYLVEHTAIFISVCVCVCTMCVWYVLILFFAVADADATVKNLEQEADRLIDKLKPIKELEDNLKKNISEIKELINQARKQANSVSSFDFSVSVTDCNLGYSPQKECLPPTYRVV